MTPPLKIGYQSARYLVGVISLCTGWEDSHEEL